MKCTSRGKISAAHFRTCALVEPVSRDDGAWLEMRDKVLHDVAHAVDGSRKHDNIGIASRLGEIPGALVDGPEFFRGALMVEIGIEADHLQRLAPVDLSLLGPAAQGETDRTADQPQSDNQHTLHQQWLAFFDGVGTTKSTITADTAPYRSRESILHHQLRCGTASSDRRRSDSP